MARNESECSVSPARTYSRWLALLSEAVKPSSYLGGSFIRTAVVGGGLPKPPSTVGEISEPDKESGSRNSLCEFCFCHCCCSVPSAARRYPLAERVFERELEWSDANPLPSLGRQFEIGEMRNGDGLLGPPSKHPLPRPNCPPVLSKAASLDAPLPEGV